MSGSPVHEVGSLGFIRTPGWCLFSSPPDPHFDYRGESRNLDIGEVVMVIGHAPLGTSGEAWAVLLLTASGVGWTNQIALIDLGNLAKTGDETEARDWVKELGIEELRSLMG